jgi:hypothetical protein
VEGVGWADALTTDEVSLVIGRANKMPQRQTRSQQKGRTIFALDGHHQPRATRTLQERVVLIHCSASSARQWSGLVDQLVSTSSYRWRDYSSGVWKWKDFPD